MSDLLGDVDVEFPKTVSRCHAEIERLRDLIREADTQLSAKESRIDELEGEIAELEEAEEDGNVDTDSAINALLDECERTGPLRYDLAQTDRAHQAIVKLHDIVGRNA